MYIHKEGYPTILLSLIVCLGISILALNYIVQPFAYLVIGLILLFFVFILSFFRNPNRTIPVQSGDLVYAPADGKVVVVEKTIEQEYLKDDRIQVSIFMSPLNVHVNRIPTSGTIEYSKYHKGKYLVAWHPKSSSENERTTVVLNTGKYKLVFRQIAGALARRIVNYAIPGTNYVQGEEYGFIKFGSRVDVFLPLNAEIQVNLDQHVVGNKTVIAKLA